MFSEIRRGMLTSTPLVVGLMPLALILGAQASQVGQSPLTALLMTFINFAGGSEFAALGLWDMVPPVLMIAFSTFLINSRLIILGTALAPYIRDEGGFRIAFVYFLMCDETWALAMQDIQRRNMEAKPFSFFFYMGLGVPVWLTWWSSTFVGAVVGNTIGDMSSFGFNMALPATFIGLAVAMRPKKSIAYIPIAISFIVSALTAKYGNPNYCVGAGALCGLIAAWTIRIIQERLGLIATQGELKEVPMTDSTSEPSESSSTAATAGAATSTAAATASDITAPANSTAHADRVTTANTASAQSTGSDSAISASAKGASESTMNAQGSNSNSTTNASEGK